MKSYKGSIGDQAKPAKCFVATMPCGNSKRVLFGVAIDYCNQAQLCALVMTGQAGLATTLSTRRQEDEHKD
jgi:hypothetical protein